MKDSSSVVYEVSAHSTSYSAQSLVVASLSLSYDRVTLALQGLVCINLLNLFLLIEAVRYSTLYSTLLITSYNTCNHQKEKSCCAVLHSKKTLPEVGFQMLIDLNGCFLL